MKRYARVETQVADVAQVAPRGLCRRGLESDGGWRVRSKLGSSELPAVMPASVVSIEFLFHAWDFAQGTGCHVVVTEPASGYVLGLARRS